MYAPEQSLSSQVPWAKEPFLWINFPQGEDIGDTIEDMHSPVYHAVVMRKWSALFSGLNKA
jgi:hypothetical protein